MFIHKVVSGPEKQYVKRLLRRSDRVGGRVVKTTLANLSSWPSEKVRNLESLLDTRRLLRSSPAAVAECDRLIASALLAGIPASKTWRLVSEPFGRRPRAS